MGNIQSKSKDHKPEQHPDQGMREIGFPLGQKIPLGGPFFIEGKLNNGIYEFRIYHLDQKGTMTEIFSFETAHPLRNEFKVVYDGSIVKFVFQTDSFEKGLKHVLEYSFDFSASFHSEKEFSGSLKSMPFLLHPDRKITNLNKNYWYYWITVDATHYELYIVESSDKSQLGFESTFKRGDTVIQKINVKSSNFPFVMNNEQGNLVIASPDEGFEQIPIRLPSDDLTLSQVLGQETFP
jgi:hypothetical protein